MIRVIRQGWDQLSIYLPVLLMGLLALGTWWLVRNAPMPQLPAIDRPVKHQPDYFMKNFSVKSFDATGRLQSEVQGTEARHYPDTDTLEIDKVRMRSIGLDGRLTVATANRALSNADGSEVQLFGNAIVTREPLPAKPGALAQPRMEFRGEFLHAFTNTERCAVGPARQRSRGATTASRPMAWTTTTSTRCCNCAGACAA